MGFDLRDLGSPCVVVHRQQRADGCIVDVEAREVEVRSAGNVADRSLVGACSAFKALDDPLKNSGVLAKARPQERTIVALAEPVDPEQFGKVRCVGCIADLKPMLEVVAHVVATERKHGEGIETKFADNTGSSCSLFRTHDRAEEHTVAPIE